MPKIEDDIASIGCFQVLIKTTSQLFPYNFREHSKEISH